MIPSTLSRPYDCGEINRLCSFTVFIPNGTAIDTFENSVYGKQIQSDANRYQWVREYLYVFFSYKCDFVFFCVWLTLYYTKLSHYFLHWHHTLMLSQFDCEEKRKTNHDYINVYGAKFIISFHHMYAVLFLLYMLMSEYNPCVRFNSIV